MIERVKVVAKVVEGHRVASGSNDDERYPGGTLALQIPYFQARGIDLSIYYRGTLNVDISPKEFAIKRPLHLVHQLDWSPFIPPENFFFFDLRLTFEGNIYEGLVYMPDPSTKEDHPQASGILELILPRIPNIGYGDHVEIELHSDQLAII
ncbi:MAG: hypothetical protein AAFY71_05395 [Bacteroidota bacterium]